MHKVRPTKVCVLPNDKQINISFFCLPTVKYFSFLGSAIMYECSIRRKDSALIHIDIKPNVRRNLIRCINLTPTATSCPFQAQPNWTNALSTKWI